MIASACEAEVISPSAWDRLAKYARKHELTTEMAFGLQMASQVVNLDMVAKAEVNRTAANEAMADVFDQVDFAQSPADTFQDFLNRFNRRHHDEFRGDS